MNSFFLLGISHLLATYFLRFLEFIYFLMMQNFQHIRPASKLKGVISLNKNKATQNNCSIMQTLQNHVKQSVCRKYKHLGNLRFFNSKNVKSLM